jgi:predicted peptidase
VQSVARSFVLAPQCPPGDQWIERHDRAPFRTYDQKRFRESDASRMTLEVIRQLAARFPIDPARIYVTGFSMGGSGTWDMITRHPEVFAAAVPVTGVGDPSRAPVIARLPIWAFHGELDDVSPVENSRKMMAALRQAGSDARYTELAGVGHGSAGPAYSNAELYGWLFAQRREPRPGTAAPATPTR